MQNGWNAMSCHGYMLLVTSYTYDMLVWLWHLVTPAST